MADSKADPISPVGASRPELTVSAASINHEPVELDSTPTSSEQVRLARRGSKATALDAIEADKNARAAEAEHRAQLISERQEDPAVLVDIPQTPHAEELERSGAARDETNKHVDASRTRT